MTTNWAPESEGPDARPNWNDAQAAGAAPCEMQCDLVDGAGWSGPGELLAGRGRVTLQREEDVLSVTVPAACWPASALSATFQTVSVPVPAGFLGRTVRVSVLLDAAAGGINAIVEIDDFAIAEATVSADLNCDSPVDGADLGILLGRCGARGGCAADPNRDGTADGADLGIVLGAWTE